MTTRRYWPYAVPALDQLTSEDRRDFGFLDCAFRQGHQAYDMDRMVLGATSANGREGELIRRGGRGRYWEIALLDNGDLVRSAFVDGFEAASEAVLLWLRGLNCLATIKRIEQAIVTKPGERGW